MAFEWGSSKGMLTNPKRSGLDAASVSDVEFARMASAFRKLGLAFCLVACAANAAIAQVFPSSTGREREQFTEPLAPRAKPGGAAISLPSTVAPPGAEKIKIVLRGVHIVGSTVYSVEQLAALYQDELGHTVSLQSVYELAQRITAKYGKDGYVLSRAIVPPQNLDPSGAAVKIQVVEGYIDKVEWPAKLSRYRDFFSSYAAKITGERPANIRTIERYLLLAGDLPGLKFSTRLKPSETNPGASTLVAEVTEKPLDVVARFDNRTMPGRGPAEFLVSPTFNNVLGQHEALTLTYAAATTPKELQYAAGYYRQVLTSEGLTAFVDGSYSWGTPGTLDLETLRLGTNSGVGEAGLSYPMIRSRERNLTFTGLAFLSDNYSDILGARFNQDRLRGIRARADADAADSLLGINQFNVTFSQGIEGLGSTENGNPLASRAAGRVDFSKVEASISRLQPLFSRFSAYVSAYGQYAFNPLLVPEQCGFGGRFFGRAYDPSQLLGDSCFELSGELRYDIPVAAQVLSNVQLYGFTDYGKLYTREPSIGTPSTTDGASAGAGVRLDFQNHFSADVQAAKAVAGPRDDWRFFIIATARY
jgi:hemolysin activation/secretion protein